MQITLRELHSRIKNIRAAMEDEKLDGFFVLHPRNVLYMTGIESGSLFITPTNAIFYAKDLYLKIHEDMLSKQNLETKEYEKGIIAKDIEACGVKRMGVEGGMGIQRFTKFREEIKAEIIPSGIVNSIRSVKSGYEIERIKKSCDIAKKGMKKAFEIIQPSVAEQSAIAEIEYAIRKEGSDAPPFDMGMLLASGKESADIHPAITKKSIGNGCTVVVDLGAKYEGYYSDMTRTITVGRIDKKDRELVDFVRDLENSIIDRIDPGISASALHTMAEEEIKKRGYKFYHSLGHGVGLEIHELPTIGPESSDVLKPNMVFTIEPGIYIPNRFGVRFEDTILLKKKGYEVLTGMKETGY